MEGEEENGQPNSDRCILGRRSTTRHLRMVEIMNVSVEIQEGHILAVYFSVRPGRVAKTVEAGNGVQIDFNAAGLLVGVELLNPAQVRIVERIGKKHHIPELSRARSEFKRAFHEMLSAA